MGATIIDSLDTLYIMGMHAEFQRCAADTPEPVFLWRTPPFL